jgi:phosphoribosylformimino-5-aminoimidazole carboxamide ribotide isomerase
MILPVLDVMQGQIVRGIAGRRDEYRPIVSNLAPSAEPLAVARAFREQFGFEEFYLADLDAIRGGNPALEVYRLLQGEGLRLWIDAGIHTSHDAVLESLAVHASSIIVGLESVHGPDELSKLVQRFGPERIVFSLDMSEGMPLLRPEFWFHRYSWPLAEYVIGRCGVCRMIVLDLSQVGGGQGISGDQGLWCRRLKEWPVREVITGGGVRGMDDVRTLLKCGADRVLVASALHDGRITPAEVQSVAGASG